MMISVAKVASGLVVQEYLLQKKREKQGGVPEETYRFCNKKPRAWKSAGLAR